MEAGELQSGNRHMNAAGSLPSVVHWDRYRVEPERKLVGIRKLDFLRSFKKLSRCQIWIFIAIVLQNDKLQHLFISRSQFWSVQCSFKLKTSSSATVYKRHGWANCFDRGDEARADGWSVFLHSNKICLWCPLVCRCLLSCLLKWLLTHI